MTNLYEFIEIFKRITRFQIDADDLDKNLIIGPSYISKQKRRKIKKAILALNLSKDVLIEALRNKIDLILIFNFEEWERNLIDENLEIVKYIIENNINVYQIPESWIYSEGGLNETIANILKLEIEGVFNIQIDNKTLPYGRICSPFKSQLRYSLLLNLISEKLGLNPFQYLIKNKSSDIVEKCVILLGRDAKNNWLRRAKIDEIGLFIGNGLTYSLARYSETIGINFIDLTYSPIRFGISRLSKILSIECPEIEFMEIDSSFPLRFFST